ncbi:MAG: hypothetical protein GAK43_00956 [Stenotrophomonas maltophilia]|nr:MAG: hypothetical protein GAK43_00956 [Stenotrophomonas maltophilia]
MRRLLLITALLAGTAQASQPLTIDVHRDAYCTCCEAWIEHLRANGFQVQEHIEADMSRVKHELGVPPSLASCHTGVIDGRFVEGHVPARDILALRQNPKLRGLAVPGMPVGSPGMEMGARQDAYQVIGLSQAGERVVLADYPAH